MRVNSAIVRFAVFMLLTLALPFSVILFVAANQLSRMEKEIANQYLSSNLRTVASTMDQVLTNLERLHAFIFMDIQFLNSLRRLTYYEGREEFSDFINISNIRNRITNVAATNNYISSIFAYSFPAKRIFSSRVNWNPDFHYFPDAPWLQVYREQGLVHPWYITHDIFDNRPILASYREVWSMNQHIGLVSINIDITEIARMLYEVFPPATGSTFIIDDHGNIIRSIGEFTGQSDLDLVNWLSMQIPNGDTGFFDTSFEGNEIFVSYYRSPYSGFRFVTASPLKQIQTGTSIMFTLLMIFMLLQGVMIIGALLLARHYFWFPLRILFDGMRKVQEGNFSLRLPKNPTYEFGYINNNFNIMTENIQKLIEENYASKLITKEAQLKNIQDQLNEHFLYNTLDTIHWLALKENATQASQMVLALANFYRVSLSAGRDIIPVRDVIQMIQNYLYIQKLRMKDALNYTISCDPSLENTLMPKGLLQPLVENALIHGLKSLHRPGELQIVFEENLEYMRVTVKDNGHGFTDKRLRQVLDQLESPDSFREQGFALKTVQSQVWLYYNSKIPINIETSLDKGTAVWFEVPLIIKDFQND
jgi:two-component system sensor histidine kinase YesM